jgi:hypothetical protein
MLDDKIHATLARELSEAVHKIGALLGGYGNPMNDEKVLKMLVRWSRRDFDIEGNIHHGDITLREDRAPDVPACRNHRKPSRSGDKFL